MTQRAPRAGWKWLPQRCWRGHQLLFRARTPQTKEHPQLLTHRSGHRLLVFDFRRLRKRQPNAASYFRHFDAGWLLNAPLVTALLASHPNMRNTARHRRRAVGHRRDRAASRASHRKADGFGGRHGSRKTNTTAVATACTMQPWEISRARAYTRVKIPSGTPPTVIRAQMFLAAVDAPSSEQLKRRGRLHGGARCSDSGDISGPPPSRRVNVRRSSFNSPRHVIVVSRPFIREGVVNVTVVPCTLPLARVFTGSGPMDKVPVASSPLTTNSSTDGMVVLVGTRPLSGKSRLRRRRAERDSCGQKADRDHTRHRGSRMCRPMIELARSILDTVVRLRFRCPARRQHQPSRQRDATSSLTSLPRSLCDEGVW